MRWPRRRWAVTQYYYGIADGVVSRHWTERAATRAAGREKRRTDREVPNERIRRAYEYRVGRREVW